MATSSTQSGFVNNWQGGKSVTECNLHMLETEDFTDVTFLVGSEKHVVRAHRYVLASRTCIFHAMFCGPMTEERDIIIPDIKVNVFRDFLRFLYTDDVTINPINVIGLMYTARKYDVKTLFEASNTFLEKSLSEENLCLILEESHVYGETDLEEKALEMLRHSSSKVTKSPAFLELCSGCFGTFLKSENLKLKVEEVFEAALSWTKRECEREGLSPSHENMRKILGEMVYEIRFSGLSLEFLNKVVGPSGILTAEERICIADRILDSSVDISPFSSADRKTTSIDSAKHDSGAINTVQRSKTNKRALSPRRNIYSLSFSTNKSITLLGCQLYGSDSEETTKVDIQLLDNLGHLISHPVQDTPWTLGNIVNDVMFPHPISIQAGRVYTICVDYGPGYFNFGNEGHPRISEAGVEFTFKKGSVEEGEIPGLIWR